MVQRARYLIDLIKAWFFITSFVISGLLLSLWLFIVLDERHQKQIKAEFKGLTEQRIQVLDNHVQRSLEVLYGLSSFLSWPHNREFEVFREYVSGSLDRLPEVQALEWIPIVSNDQRVFFETRAREEGLREYQIIEFDGQGQLREASTRSEYYPVYFAYPRDANVEAIGLDLASQPDRKKAIEASLESGTIVATAPVRLAQEKVDSVHGVLIFAPVYSSSSSRNAKRSSTNEGRHPSIEGFALVVYRSVDLLSAVFADLKTSGISVSVSDCERQQVTLYSNSVAGDLPATMKNDQIIQSYEIGNRKWCVSFTPADSFHAANAQLSVFAYPAASALLVLAFGFYATVRNRYLSEVEREVQNRTLALQQEVESRRVAQAQATQAEQMYRSIFDNAIDGIFQTTRDGVYLNANSALAHIYGYESCEAFIDSMKNIEQQLYVDPGRRSQFIECMQRDGQVRDFISEVYRADGSRIFILEKAISVFDDCGKFLYYEGNVQDITSRVEAENALQQANEWLEDRVSQRTAELAQANRELLGEVHIREAAEREAAEANAAKTQFLAGISHEIRTPLNAIIGYSQILQQQTDLQAKQQLAIKTIAQSGNHLLSLVDDILDLSKIEAGLVEVTPIDFNLASMINNIAYLVRRKCEDKGLQLRIEGLGQKPVWVRGDEGKLRQILINLLSNAVKYTMAGEVILRVVPELEFQYRFEVIDTGPGIPENDLSRIFDQFFQRATGQEGAGLGLSIASRIASAIQTKIEVRSTFGLGSNFFFHLDFDAPQSTPNEYEHLSAIDIRLRPGEQCLALVVDDIQHNRDILQKMLEAFGCDVLCADCGLKALEYTALQEPTIVFMDIHMPGMDGIETREKIIQQCPKLAAIFVAFSASAYEDQRKHYLQTGFDAVISKPFLIAQLSSCLLERLHHIFEPVSQTSAKTTTFIELPSNVIEPLISAAKVYNITQIKRLLTELSKQSRSHAELAHTWRQLVDQHQLERLIGQLENHLLDDKQQVDEP